MLRVLLLLSPRSTSIASVRPVRSSRLLRLLPVAFAAAACSEPVGGGAARTPVIYGDDDRQDPFAYSDPAWAERASDFSAAMIALENIDFSDPDDVRLPPNTLAEVGDVCPDERFAYQPSASICSGTLIAPDLILTAGHCFDLLSCRDFAFVFDYTMADVEALGTITQDDVYPCDEVVATLADDIDFAVVRLDREVVGHTPAFVNRSPVALPPGRPLVVSGYPSGLPLKIEDGATVRDPHTRDIDFFVSNSDTFGGSSGSGVFDDGSKQLVGILVRGDVDYVPDESSGCDRVHRCTDSGCGGEDSTYAFRAMDNLCDVLPAALPCACGDALCDPSVGETTATCAADCGSLCGDLSCNGAETPADCALDCGTCGNGVCDGDDSPITCCADCGCLAEDVCQVNRCVPDPGEADTCDNALVIEADGIQVVDGDTTTAQNDLAGRCVGVTAPDRVYEFELVDRTRVEALVTGYDTGLYLRRGCADPMDEIACNDDIDGEGGRVESRVAEVLGPGSYALVVDGFNEVSVGPFTLTVTFDTCIDDPDKIEPGVCGCGTSDVDTDEDGTPDCDEEDGGSCASSGRGGGAPGGLLALALLAFARFARRRPARRAAG